MSSSPTLPRLTTTKLVLLAGISLVTLVVVSSLSVSAQNQRRLDGEADAVAPASNPAIASPEVEIIQPATAEPQISDLTAQVAAQVTRDAEDQSIEAQVQPAANDGKLRFENAQTSLIQNAFVAAPMAGVVDGVNAREGQTVYLDDPLVRLQSELAEKELVATKAAYDAATLESDNDVDLRYAKRTLQVRENEMRQSLLANRTYAGAVSEMELEALRLKVDQAALAIEQAGHELMVASAAAIEKQAAVSISQTKLDRHIVRTTVAGMITEVAVEPGEWVEAGEPLVRIISLDPIRVECFVDGRKHGRELVGRDVEFIPSGAGNNPALPGSITFVSPELHPVTGQVRVWATVSNPDGKIGSGTPGTLELK